MFQLITILLSLTYFESSFNFYLYVKLFYLHAGNYLLSADHVFARKQFNLRNVKLVPTALFNNGASEKLSERAYKTARTPARASRILSSFYQWTVFPRLTKLSPVNCHPFIPSSSPVRIPLKQFFLSSSKETSNSLITDGRKKEDASARGIFVPRKSLSLSSRKVGRELRRRISFSKEWNGGGRCGV